MQSSFISTITEFVKPSNLFKKTTGCGLIKKIAASAVVVPCSPKVDPCGMIVCHVNL